MCNSSNEFNFTRLAAKIIGDNLNKSPIEIGNLIVRGFHSQGAVIKVDRELPQFSNNYSGLQQRYQEILLRAGWGFFEPLIKDD